MAKLSTAIRGFGEPSRQTQKELHTPDLDNAEKGPESNRLYVEISPMVQRFSKDSSKKASGPSLCLGDCEAQRKILREENSQLIATVRQLRTTISEYEAKFDKLQAANKQLQDHAAISQSPPENEFDKRLNEIEQALSHGLAHTLNALQSMRQSKQLEGSENTKSSVGPKGVLCNLGGEFPSYQTGPVAGPSSEPVPHRFYERAHNFPGDETSLESITSQKELTNFARNKQRNERRESCHTHKITEVKSEIPDESMTSDVSKNILNREKAQSSKDNFDDITFFVKPSASKTRRALNLSGGLMKTKMPKYEPALVERKTDPETSGEHYCGLKREHQDENEHVRVKRESTKKRKALEPITKNRNSRASSAAGRGIKPNHTTFDFVETLTLLEQSRASLNKR